MMTKRERNFGCVSMSQVPGLTLISLHNDRKNDPISGYGGGGPYDSTELEEGHKLNSMGIVSNVTAGECHD